MSDSQNEFDQTRNAMFEVRRTISSLEVASGLVMTAREAFQCESSGALWFANKSAMGHNFKRIMLEELDAAMQQLSSVRSRLENI